MIKINKISWFKIEKICLQIIEDIKKDKFKPDVIVTIQRGGFIPTAIISHGLEIRELIVTDIKRTISDKVNSKKQPPKLINNLDRKKIEAKKVLIVDDIVGSGETLTLLVNKIMNLKPFEVRTAVVILNLDNYEKKLKQERPVINFLGKQVRGWVVFPWEKK